MDQESPPNASASIPTDSSETPTEKNLIKEAQNENSSTPEKTESSESQPQAKTSSKSAPSSPAVNKKLPPGPDLRKKALEMHKTMKTMWGSKGKQQGETGQKEMLLSLAEGEAYAMDLTIRFLASRNNGRLNQQDSTDIYQFIRSITSDRQALASIIVEEGIEGGENKEENGNSNGSIGDVTTGGTKKSLIASKYKALVEARLRDHFPLSPVSSSQPSTPPSIIASLPTLPLPSAPLTRAQGFHRIFFSRQQGPKSVMEDEVSVIDHIAHLFGLPSTSDQLAFVGVYDGHLGVQAAEYSRIHLCWNVVHDSHFSQGNVLAAFQNAYAKTDRDFLQMANRMGIESGTTATTVLVGKEKFWLANVGDSTGVISRAGKAEELTTCHQPKMEEEKGRLQRAGGVVVWYGTWRVNGVLAVSRAIGDPKLKKCVISDPSLREATIDEGDEMILLASDGLWDVIAPQEAVDTCRRFISAGGDPSSLPDWIIQEAYARGSNDNISFVLILFGQC